MVCNVWLPLAKQPLLHHYHTTTLPSHSITPFHASPPINRRVVRGVEVLEGREGAEP